MLNETLKTLEVNKQGNETFNPYISFSLDNSDYADKNFVDKYNLDIKAAFEEILKYYSNLKFICIYNRNYFLIYTNIKT